MAIFFNCLMGFLFFISGNFFLYDLSASFLKNIVQFFSSFYLLFYLFLHQRFVSVKFTVLSYIIIGLSVLLFFSITSESIFYGLKKIDSVIVCSFLCCIYFSGLVRKYGVDIVFYNIKRVAVFVLILTVIYKIYFGFFDREINFFLNGPNVFGWLQGFYFLLVLYSSRKTISYKNIFLLMTFLLSVFWSQSKGSLISLVVSVFLLCYICYLKDKYKFKIIFYQLFLIVLIIFIGFFVLTLFYDIEQSRLFSITKIFSSSRVDDSDYGSIGIRADMYSAAFDLFTQNYFLGVGLGNFSLYSGYSDFEYPHNVPLEILAETGLLGFLLFLSYFSLFLKRNKSIILLVFCFYFFVACLFSGDLGYFRYSMLFLLLGLNLVKDIKVL